MWGEIFWWWLEVSRQSKSELKLEVRTGGVEDDSGLFLSQIHESAVVTSWLHARSTLSKWAEHQLFLPAQILDHAVRGLLAEMVKGTSKIEKSW